MSSRRVPNAGTRPALQPRRPRPTWRLRRSKARLDLWRRFNLPMRASRAVAYLPIRHPRHAGSLGAALLNRASWVHQRLTDAERLHVSIGEDTVTQDLLLDLRLMYPRLVVKPFTRWEESRHTGADWEWWIEGHSYWFGFRVQAKKLLPTTGGDVGYDFGSRPGRPHAPRQIETLIASSARHGVPAIYALYNGPRLDLSSFPWRCGQLPPVAPVAGVTAVGARTARTLFHAGTTNLSDVGAYARPWSCLATCLPGFTCPGPGAGGNPLFGGPWTAAALAAHFGDPAIIAALFVLGLDRRYEDDRRFSPDDVLFGVGRGDRRWLHVLPPPYVLRALTDEVRSVDIDDDDPPRHLLVQPL